MARPTLRPCKVWKGLILAPVQRVGHLEGKSAGQGTAPVSGLVPGIAQALFWDLWSWEREREVSSLH